MTPRLMTAFYNVPSEHDEQTAFFKLVRTYREDPRYPKLNRVFAVPNGGHRHDTVALKLSEEGVEPGVPDVLVLCRGGETVPYLLETDMAWRVMYCRPFMAIEFKRADRRNEKLKGVFTGGLSDYQLAWATEVVEETGRYVVAYSWVEAWEELCDYLGYQDLKGVTL